MRRLLVRGGRGLRHGVSSGSRWWASRCPAEPTNQCLAAQSLMFLRWLRPQLGVDCRRPPGNPVESIRSTYRAIGVDPVSWAPILWNRRCPSCDARSSLVNAASVGGLSHQQEEVLITVDAESLHCLAVVNAGKRKVEQGTEVLVAVGFKSVGYIGHDLVHMILFTPGGVQEVGQPLLPFSRSRHE